MPARSYILQPPTDSLRVVHVAGTKGKGSVAALVERQLRSAGLRTGLFSSPHLVSEAERVRLNGAAAPTALLASRLLRAHTRLAAQCSAELGMPSWFRMLTLLALDVFVHARVDVAVVEVGVGGRADATNVVDPVVCGITALGFDSLSLSLVVDCLLYHFNMQNSLVVLSYHFISTYKHSLLVIYYHFDIQNYLLMFVFFPSLHARFDHMTVLGDTLPEIAAEKAGIFKRGVPAFTVEQRADAAATLCSKASVVDAPLALVRPAVLPAGVEAVKIGIAGKHQESNAALAVALAHAFLARSGYLDGSTLSRNEWSNLQLEVNFFFLFIFVVI